MSGTEIESLDSRKLKHGWLYKTAPLLVVSGCGSLQPYCDRRPVSRWLEAAIESVGSHVSLVTEVQLLRRHSSPTRPLVSVLSKRWVPCCDHGPAGPADDQLLLAYRHMGSPSLRCNLASLEDRPDTVFPTVQRQYKRERHTRDAQPGRAFRFGKVGTAVCVSPGGN